MPTTPTTTPGVAAQGEPILWAGRYELGERLGSGGLATVYRGRLVGPLGFTRGVAIKRLHPHWSQRSDAVMFLDEARIASCIAHPNVVATLDVVQEAGEYAVVMELIDGATFEALLTGGAPPLPVTLRIVCDMLRGLHAAHVAKDAEGQALHVVHRDVAPSNVLIGRDGLARISDFGVAKARGRMVSTRNGEVKGHLSYMAPEQLVGDEVDARADTFSTGVVLWEALTGRRLFYAESEAQTVYALLERPIVKPSAVAEVPPAVDEVVMRALAREREARYESASAMADAIEASSTLASRGDVAAWVNDSGAKLHATGTSAEQGNAAVADTWLDAPPSMTLSTTPPPAQARTRGRVRFAVSFGVSLVAIAGIAAMVSPRSARHPAAATASTPSATIAADEAPPPRTAAATAPTASSVAPVPAPTAAAVMPAAAARAGVDSRPPAKPRARPRAPTPVRLYERD